jgi:hypothetical protein
MKDLAYDIEQLYIEGFSPVSISAQLQCPLSMIYDWLEAQNVQEDTNELTEE